MGFAEVLGEVEKSMGILSGLKNLGLGNLENMDVFEGQKKQEAKKPEPFVAQKPQEKDLIYERSFTCPVCDTSFTSKVMKSNKARLLGTDQDLRPRYDGIDAAKYEVVMCPVCGCAALMRYFTTITSAQAKLIRDNICQVLKMKPYQGETYTYEHALERYQLALAEAVVKRSKTSERAYICLKYAWLVRGYAEDLKGRENPDEKQLAELAAQEGELLQNAYKGFTGPADRNVPPVRHERDHSGLSAVSAGRPVQGLSGGREAVGFHHHLHQRQRADQGPGQGHEGAGGERAEKDAGMTGGSL